MPVGLCGGCGRITNSTTSNWWMTNDRKPTKCAVAWEKDGTAVRGCGYDQASKQMQEYADEVIKSSNERAARAPREQVNGTIKDVAGVPGL